MQERTEAESPARQPKVVRLKQFFVQEGLEPGEKPRATAAAFVLQTCALNARREFEEKTGRKAGQCV